MKKDNLYLRHISEACENIDTFMSGIKKEAFMKDKLVQSAVIRQLEIIGEAVKNLSANLKKTHNNIPWKDMAGLRDKLIHGYFGVDISLVWTICTKDIPELKKKLAAIPFV
ncbi:MAG TPA: DUF86 domain-containing protein [Planctomycetota bacterium]|nr:DUF86 domain-containing protein [Planctomycetota bacterium]